MRKFVPSLSKQFYLMIALALLAVACQDRSVMREMPPVAIAQATAQPTAVPTDLPVPTAAPSDTPMPTVVPAVTATPLPAPPAETAVPTIAAVPTDLPPPTAVPVVTITPFADASNMYIVREGETLETIGAAWGIRTVELANANGITNYLTVVPGQLLILPLPTPQPTATATPVPSPTIAPTVPVSPFDPNNYRSHTVLSGQTLFRIGLDYGFSVDELLLYNQIDNANLIYPGDVIRIPYR